MHKHTVHYIRHMHKHAHAATHTETQDEGGAEQPAGCLEHFPNHHHRGKEETFSVYIGSSECEHTHAHTDKHKQTHTQTHAALQIHSSLEEHI